VHTQSKEYNPSFIESHWQAFWESDKTFAAFDFSEKPPYYVLDMFPYPSGAGLHIGHPEGYTASDILGRYKKACGYNVLHPMGWDAFGLPAEQHALSTGVHPATNTRMNIDNFRKQIKRLGFGIDWNREVDTTDPKYFRWTQWIFLQLFKAGLAYVDEKPVWWCPALGTVLANEEIVDGVSERGNHPVERRNLRQWVLRITAYADKLLEGLEDIHWPDSTKRQQIAWIGRSEGATVRFELPEHPGQAIEAYTTRIDTLFGTTFLVIAPEHRLVDQIVSEEQCVEVEAYVEKAKSKSDLARTDLAKEKSGVFSGAYAINPVNGEHIPVWIADYVLASYGTGAVMGVPAHDERDNEFAKHYHLPIITVLDAKDPFNNDASKLIHSEKYNGLVCEEAKHRITQDLEQKGLAQASVHYKLRDWLFSRQRYWGEPFPIVWIQESDYDKVAAHPTSPFKEFLPKEPVRYKAPDGTTLVALPIPSSALPLTLPDVESYQPSGDGESPLVNAPEWIAVALNLKTGQTVPTSEQCAVGDWIHGRRETNTMPQWAGSCWYYLRYLDPRNDAQLLDPELEKYWGMPEFYIGGSEHAVLHLLYARFWHRFLYEQGVVSTKEPFMRLFHQGIILGEDGSKMSKSKGNTVDPDAVINDHSADALRLFEMFMGPLADMKPWSSQGIVGIDRFLQRIFREFINSEDGTLAKKWSGTDSPPTLRLLHATIKKVTEDIEALSFNTAISQMMVLLNHLQKETSLSRETGKAFLQMLAPFAPHIAEELWARLGEKPSITNARWPTYDASLLISNMQKLAVQVNGRLRATLEVPTDLSETDILSKARALPEIAGWLDSKSLKKELYVPGKIVNFVV
jgi:leucyl-tRNA synthetase